MSDGLTYVVVIAPKKDPKAFAIKVSLLMAEGWWVQGGISVSGQNLHQAMSKRTQSAMGRVASADNGDWVEPA